MTDAVIEARGVSKSFGTTRALEGVDLVVERGTVLGLLGPNGAGKTTLVRILTTLLAPDAGTARVAGHDVVREAPRVRAEIGLAGQFAAVDDLLTGRENLELVGLLYHLPKAERKRRAGEVLERLGLTDAGDRLARTYSGGMRRRLDLGASLVGRPSVLILDEPTTGLDPATRVDLWGFIEDLVASGMTLLLTTQYLEEADRLANRIVVIDHGRTIAEGTASELKDQLGGDLLEVTVADPAALDRAVELVAGLAHGSPTVDRVKRLVSAPATGKAAAVVAAASRFQAEGIDLEEISLRRPSLDDVFLALTGHGAEDVAAGSGERTASAGGAPARRARRAS